MGREGGEQQSANLPSWPPPQDGYERILKLNRRAARRRPLRAWEIVFIRVWLIVAAAVVGAMLAAGPAWAPAVIGVAGGQAGVLLGWLVIPAGRFWLLQIAGVRPPAK